MYKILFSPLHVVGYFVVHSILIFQIGLVAYCMVHGDLDRIFKGYDDCGNICGIKNKPISGPQDVFRHCSGINLESKP